MFPFNAATTRGSGWSLESIRSNFQSSLTAHPVLWFLGTLFIVRCSFIYFSPLDLIADESYYWDWSRRLDYGYYSKPPMIAWINWASTSLLGANEFAVRLPAALLGTVGLVWVYLLGAKLYSYRVGMFSMLLLAFTPGQTAMSFLMTIDAPFLFCWVAALYCFWMLTCDPVPQLRWCLLTALWLGLGVLSKQTMLAFYPLAGLFLLVTPAKWSLLGSARLWLTAVAGLLFLTPVILWNAQHDWITFQHTAAHFDGKAVSYTTQLIRFLEFFVGQIGVVSPVLWGSVVVTLWAAFRQFPRLTSGERYLLCFSGVPLIGIVILSATRRLEPNWPAACYPAAVILTTAALFGRTSLINLFKNRDRQLAWSWKVGLACSLVTYAAITIVPASPLAGGPFDVTCRLRGWKSLAAEFAELQQQASSQPGSPLVIATAGRDVTSALAFYLPHQPLIPYWADDHAGVQCQYDLWAKPDVAAHREVIVIATPDAPLPESLASAADWQAAGTLTVPLGGQRQRHYQLYKATPLKSGRGPHPIENTAVRPTSPRPTRLQ